MQRPIGKINIEGLRYAPVTLTDTFKTMQKVLQGELPLSVVPEHTSMFLDRSL